MRDGQLEHGAAQLLGDDHRAVGVGAGQDPRRGVAALLTGMGRDGAAGLLLLRQRGWTTIAQDEESSVVYGMPRAAADLGAATHILAISRVAAAIAAAVGTG